MIMKISYNLLKELLPCSLSPSEIASILTEIGLEVEGVEEYVSHKGLDKVVVGEVLEKHPHPNADKLSVTKVNIGNDKILNIVCGAPNVAVGQKVLVALVGAQLHTTKGDTLEIRTSKIRGERSEGMICAAYELGLSEESSGIMILPNDVPVGLSASDYLKVSRDIILEIGLTANRGDAASHIGIARDLKAYLKTHFSEQYADLTIHSPASLDFPESSGTMDIDIEIRNTEDCKRYAGIVINGVKVEPSPQWLQDRLHALGIRPIYNIVDITNYVMLELGQPLHAFDVRAIKGHKIIIQNAKEGTQFTTLDRINRTLKAFDLMICNAEEPMCMAGVMGGLHSSIQADTQTVFIESAWFNPSSIRRTSRWHGLKTESSFRFERFTDPDMVVYALNRACTLILEIAGGTLSMGVKDVYPQPIEPHKVGYSIRQANDLFGQEIPFEVTKKIIEELGIQIESESHEGMLLRVPPYKSDVTRQVDVAEEVLRIYGYNKIQNKKQVTYTVQGAQKFNKSAWEAYVYKLSEYLADKGFHETQGWSFHPSTYYEGQQQDVLIKLQNPAHSELNTLRQNLLFNALQTIAHNQRHQQKNIMGFEIGKIYWKEPTNKLKEEYHLALFAAGKNTLTESFYTRHKEFFYIKEIVERIFNFSQQTFISEEINDPPFSKGLKYMRVRSVDDTNRLPDEIAYMGFVHPSFLKMFEIETSEIIFADLYLEKLFESYLQKQTTYSEPSKFPFVERDLSLLLDKSVRYADIKKTIEQSAKPYLKEIKLFDYYEGKNIPADKKSYAVRLYLQDRTKTLTDKEIDAVMHQVITDLKKQCKAELR